MEFWGMELHPKQAKPITCNENTYLHLTQAALGTNPKDGERVVLQIGFEKEKFVLGTLLKSTCDQMHLDLLVDKDFTLEHNGSSSVFVAGYVTAADFEGAELDSGDEEDESEDEEEEDGDEEEEEAVVNAAKGNGLPEKKSKKQADGIASKAAKAAAKLGVAKAALEDLDKERKKAEVEEDDEDEDDDDDDEEGAVLRGANEFDMDDDDDDDFSEDDDEFADDLAEEDDDDDDDIEEGDFDEDDDEDDSEDDDMDEDEEGVENALPPSKGAKRPATIPKTPASQKKARVEAATPKTPTAAPSAKKTPGKDKTPAAAKTPKTPATGSTLGNYHCAPCNKNFTAETALKQHNQAKHKE